MKLSIRQIEDERLDDCLAKPDPLAQTVYGLYQCPAAEEPVCRVVVLTDQRSRTLWDGKGWAFSSRLEIDAVCQLLWSVLWDGTHRVGNVVYDCTPVEDDYVIQCYDDGYRAALVAHVDEPALAIA